MKFFHDKRLKRVDFLDERFYESLKTKGKYNPAVTSVIDGGYPKGYGYQEWLKRNGFNADIIGERAMASGSRVHEAIDAINHGVTINWYDEKGVALYDKREWEMILNYIEFITNHNVILLTTEYKFSNDELGYGGTIDCVFLFVDTGVVLVIDVKTGNEYRNHALQLAAYHYAWNLEAQVIKNKSMADGAAILYLEAATRGADKSGNRIQGRGWKLQPIEDLEYQKQIFANTYAIWKDNPETAKTPTLFSLPSEISGGAVKKIMESRVRGVKRQPTKASKTAKKQGKKPVQVKQAGLFDLPTSKRPKAGNKGAKRKSKHSPKPTTSTNGKRNSSRKKSKKF